MLQNASYMFFFLFCFVLFFFKGTKRLRKKENSITRQELNPKPSTCNGNALSIDPRNHC